MLERIQLAHTPTPIDTLPTLTKKMNGPRLLVKRDDQTGLAFGGNKTRKLETLLAEARNQQADILLTTGAAQSNHCRQAAAAAARKGFDCTLVLVGDEPETLSGNNLLDELLGANIIWTTPAERDDVLRREMEVLEKEGRSPYLIPYGGSNAVGAYAYALAVEELMRQCGEDLPDWIVFASSSGGTQAGLVAGAYHYGLKSQILGISVDERERELTSRIADLASEITPLLGFEASFSVEDIHVNDDYVGGGYGVMGSLEKNAIHTFAREEGILLDPVYTGRAAGGLLDLIQAGRFGPDESVLFWHTGGTPGLFAERYSREVF